jgi:hypothetical protein
MGTATEHRDVVHGATLTGRLGDWPVCSIARRSDLGDPADQLLDTVRQRRPGKRRQPDALHASTPDLQWISDSYTLVFAALLVLAGVLGTRLGPRRAITAGLAVFAAGSAAAALSTTSPQLIGFRAVTGLGAAFVMRRRR